MRVAGRDPALAALSKSLGAKSLGERISREVMGMIRGIAREFQVPVLCNIHDVDLALEFCDRVLGLPRAR